MNIKSSNHFFFCTHHLFVGFTVHPGACRPSSVLSRAFYVPRMRVLGLESTAMSVHFALALCVSAAGTCTCTCTAVRLLRLSHRQCPRVVDHTDETFVRPLSGLSCYLRASSRHRGLPSFLCCAHLFVSSTWAVSVPLALLWRFYVDFQPSNGATNAPVDHHRPAGQ